MGAPAPADNNQRRHDAASPHLLGRSRQSRAARHKSGWLDLSFPDVRRAHHVLLRQFGANSMF